MSGAEQAFRGLLSATLALVDALPEARDFAVGMPRTFAFTPPAPAMLPVTEEAGQAAGDAAEPARAVGLAFRDVATFAEWQQTYTEAQVGRAYLDRYGWFNLISPDGPFTDPHWRISFGYWGRGLEYPRHWHAPEELYVVVAGSALFTSDGQDPAQLGPGGTRHHSGGEPHGMQITPGPLLAFAIWKGTALTERATLER